MGLDNKLFFSNCLWHGHLLKQIGEMQNLNWLRRWLREAVSKRRPEEKNKVAKRGPEEETIVAKKEPRR